MSTTSWKLNVVKCVQYFWASMELRTARISGWAKSTLCPVLLGSHAKRKNEFNTIHAKLNGLTQEYKRSTEWNMNSDDNYLLTGRLAKSPKRPKNRDCHIWRVENTLLRRPVEQEFDLHRAKWVAGDAWRKSNELSTMHSYRQDRRNWQLNYIRKALLRESRWAHAHPRIHPHPSVEGDWTRHGVRIHLNR